MLKRYYHFSGGLLRLLDALLIGGIWLLSYSLRFHFSLLEVKRGFPAFSTYASLTPLVVILWLVILSVNGVYEPKRLLRRTDEAFLVVKAHLFAMVVFIVMTYLISEYKYSRGVLLFFGLLGGVSLVYLRVGLRNFLRRLRRDGTRSRKILAIGTLETLAPIEDRFERYPELGSKIVGVLTPGMSVGQEILQKKTVWGKPEDLPKVFKRGEIDEILIALPRSSGLDLSDLLSQISDETVDIRVVPDLHEFVALGCEVESFDGIPVLHLNGSPLNGWGQIAKRMTDFSLSLIALLILSPLLLLISILIKLSSSGQVFYRQERMGMDGRVFSMLKFRSMRQDAESKEKIGWTTPDDPRRTGFGTFLRSTSLDELPQFWNVLVGQMSLVGPRPERPHFVEKFKGQIPHYMLRHKVKAGITGWAQVNGWRGDTSLHHRIDHDLYYIRNWSYSFDWKILLLTLWRLNRNAY